MLAPIAINNLLNATRNKIQPCALAEICKALTDESSNDELRESNPRKKADEHCVYPLGFFEFISSCVKCTFRDIITIEI